MTFRPSVLPDRDNDILSTFTRSFERARQLVRQDQADRRAQQLHDLEVRERERALEDKMLDFRLDVARDPSLQFRDITPEQAEIARAFGGDQAPMIGEFDPNRPFFRPRRAAVPQEIMPPTGTPGDVQIVGDVGGETLTFSQMLGDRIRRERLAEEAEFEETLPEARRERQEEGALRESVRNLLGAGEVTTREGETVTPEMVPSAEFGRDLIEQQRGQRLIGERQVDVAQTPRPRRSSGRSPDEIRLGQARGRILTSFRGKISSAERELRGTGTAAAVERMMRERRGEPEPEVDRAALMREAIAEVQATGDISQAEADEMRQNIPQLLEEAGAGTNTPPPDGGGGPLTEAEVNQVVGILRRAGSISDEDIRADLQAEGFSDDEIQQIIDAM